MTIAFKDIPDPGNGSLRAMVQRRWIVLDFLAKTADLWRDPIVFLTLVSGLARSGMIYGVNQTALTARDGPGWSVVLLLGCAAVLLICGHFQRMRAHALTTRVSRKLRERLSRLLLRANIDFLLSSRHGKVYSAMTGEVGGLSSAILAIVEVAGAIVVLAFALPYLALVSPIAGAAALVALFVGIVGFILFDRPARKLGHATAEAFAEYCDRVGDMLGGWKELRLRDSRRSALEVETYEVIAKSVDTRMRAEKLFSASTGLGQSAVIGLLCFVVIMLPMMNGGDTATMFQVLAIVFLVNGPIEAVFSALPNMSRAETAYFKIQTVEKALSNAQSVSLQTNADPRKSFDEIALRGVEAYVREPGKPRSEGFHLGPVDLAFSPGETVFICGGNGSGKTTLLSLITGLRHPDAGEILLDGDPLAPEDAGAYRELFSAVFSGFHLFERAYGATEEELAVLEKRVAQLGLDQRVSIVEGKFSTTSLSAGQSRRLALAVALAEQRPIIVLDEFAADQDPVNRAFFYDVLVPELSASGRLVLAVTHDDHQFHKCDRLIKMDAGRVLSDVKMSVETRMTSA